MNGAMWAASYRKISDKALLCVEGLSLIFRCRSGGLLTHFMANNMVKSYLNIFSSGVNGSIFFLSQSIFPAILKYPLPGLYGISIYSTLLSPQCIKNPVTSFSTAIKSVSEIILIAFPEGVLFLAN
jgi:hypothetical protein